jgi:hypothetical protein
MENGMPHLPAPPEGDATGSDGGRDWIKQQIIRAYVELAALNEPGGFRHVTLTRLGWHEVRLTKAPRTSQPGLPPFWLEMHSGATGTTTDSFGCFELDKNELEAAVDFVCEARQRHQAGNWGHTRDALRIVGRAPSSRSAGWDKDLEAGPHKKWDPTNCVFWGSLIGMTLGIVFEARHICAGRFDDVDPFVHIATELVVFAAGGAMLFAAVAGLRNRSGRKSSRTNRRW